MFSDRSAAWWGSDSDPDEPDFASCPPLEPGFLIAVADRYDAEVASGFEGSDPELASDGVPDAEAWPPVRAVAPAEVLSRAVSMLDDRQRRVQRAEAERILALLAAYDATMTDAAAAGEPTGRHQWVAKGFLLQAGRSLRMSERGAAHLLDTARQVREDLPATWAVFVAGGCPWRLTEIAHQQADGLHTLDLPEYDARAAELVRTDASPELKRKLHAMRERLDPATAAHRRRAATTDRRVHLAPLPDGQASLTLIGPAIELAAVDHGLRRVAVTAHGHPDETRGIGALRYDAAIDLLLGGLAAHAPGALPTDAPADSNEDDVVALAAAVRAAVDSTDPEPGDGVVAAFAHRIRVPQRRPVEAKVLLVVPALGLTGSDHGMAELAGYGPIDIDQAALTAGTQGSWTRVFTDPVTGDLSAVDATARAIPAALRAWLEARDGTCRAPGCSRPAPATDLDHVRRYEHGGPTAPWNLAHLCRTHHAIKDDGCWSNRLEPNGRLHWRSRWGTEFITEPAIPAAPVAARPSTPPHDDAPAPF